MIKRAGQGYPTTEAHERPATTGTNNSSSNHYFRFSKSKPEKFYDCRCSLCLTVGSDYIIKQYQNFKDLLIEDRSKRIYDPFIEKVVGF